MGRRCRGAYPALGRLIHTLHRDRHHLVWDRSLPPVVTVSPGETVELFAQDASGGQLTPSSTHDDVPRVDQQRVNPVTGPVAVEGAAPGDTLVVAIQAVDVEQWGWSAIIPGFGLLADDFPDAYLVHSQVGAHEVALGDSGLSVPTRPFVGTIGVAPAEPGPHGLIPPRSTGGNLDCRDVRPGAVLRLPVEVDGALLSVGDTHAAQGDGEVCGTAVETPARVVLTVDVERGRPIHGPQLEIPADPELPGAMYATTGVGPDLMAASRAAVRSMIDWLGRQHGLDPRVAYVLCSVAAHLRIREVVDAPNWVVSLDLPLAVLAG